MATSNNYHALQKLMEEAEQQQQIYDQMIQSEKDFYNKTLAMENQRHQEAMNQLKRQQDERMQIIKDQEMQYKHQLDEIRKKYDAKKKEIQKMHQHELKKLEETRFPHVPAADAYEQPTMVPDAVYAEAVVTELYKLMNQNRANDPIAKRKKRTAREKIEILSDTLDAHIKLLHTVIENAQC